MAQKYIEQKVVNTLDKPTASGILSTHIGLGIPIDVAHNDQESSHTTDPQIGRGRPKTKSSSQHAREQCNSQTNGEQNDAHISTDQLESPTINHPLNHSSSYLEFLDHMTESNATTDTAKHNQSSSAKCKAVLRSNSRIDETLPTPVNAAVVSNGSTPSSLFYLVDFWKRRLTSMTSYSNMLVGLNLLPNRQTKRERSRSRSTSRSGSRSRGRSDTSNGTIEDDFVFVENIELHHLDGFLFGSHREMGKGHRFEVLHLDSPTWCDSCGDFVWGVYKQCLRCKNCKYTCHHKCRQNVALDCDAPDPGGDTSSKQSGRTGGSPYRRSRTSETSLSESRVEDAESGYHTGDSMLQHRARAINAINQAAAKKQMTKPTNTGGVWSPQKVTPPGGAQPVAKPPPSQRTLNRQDLAAKIEAFNSNQHGLPMKLTEEKCNADAEHCPCYEGFIRVHIKLMRPISMVLPAKSPSLLDGSLGSRASLDRDSLTEEGGEVTSFYLPKTTTKAIHINSSTTAHEVIQILLRKYYITDNPHKFTLYEQYINEHDEVTLHRLSDTEEPLPICLSWKAEGLDSHQFVLQDNDTDEIMWDAFSSPELENFLRILNREENEYLEQVRSKYHLLRYHMNERLQELRLEKEALKQSSDAVQLSADDRTAEPVFV